METWYRFNWRRPQMGQIVWVLTRRLKKPQLREFIFSVSGAHVWYPGMWCGDNDLWCNPKVPKMPKTR
jgi:hypothetical protein